MPYKIFTCIVCGYVYNEALGDEEHGLAPGTRWEDVPEDWEIDGSLTDEDFPDLFAVSDEGYANMFFVQAENPIDEEIQRTIDAWECTVLGASETWDDGTYVGLLQPYHCESDYTAIVVIAEDSYGERLLVDIGTTDTPYADEITKAILDSFASTS